MPRPAATDTLALESLTLARYVLPDARMMLHDSSLAARIAGDYRAAVRRHGLAPLADTLGAGDRIGTLALWAWDGLFAPESGRTLVRQRLLLMTAILESQPELAPRFLPRNMSRLTVLWTLFAASFGTAVSAMLSLGLRVARRGARG